MVYHCLEMCALASLFMVVKNRDRVLTSCYVQKAFLVLALLHFGIEDEGRKL